MINQNPLVSIICLSYNHGDFIADAINSVLAQDYPNIELIVIDDGSTDGAAEIIRQICEEQNIKYILNEKNLGNCIAFNKAYSQSSGEFVIDFAADDVLLPERVGIGVRDLQGKGDDFSVHYSDAMIIDEKGKDLGIHSKITKSIEPNEVMPEGEIFSEVLARYFICPPTLMAKRNVFEALGGYDESLSFEDFDFIIRSARDFKYCYSSDVLVKRRIVKQSKSQVQYQKGSADLWSVLAVCEKAIDLVKNKKEKLSLNRRLQYECRQVIIHNEPKIVIKYLQLMKENGLSPLMRALYRLTANVYPLLFR